MARLCSGAGALHLNNVSDLGDIDKLIDESLSVHLGKDAPLVVIPEQDVISRYVRPEKSQGVFLSTLSDNKEDCALFSMSGYLG